jgi:transcriptional regulator with XRE-family HTH domain
MIILPIQCRMARTAVGLGIRELAAAAKVSMDTIARFERGEALKERTIEALQRALEAAGIEFTNGEQPGVRLSKRAAAHHVKAADASNSTPRARAARPDSLQGRARRRP